jgi:hypothetical protein
LLQCYFRTPDKPAFFRVAYPARLSSEHRQFAELAVKPKPGAILRPAFLSSGGCSVCGTKALYLTTRLVLGHIAMVGAIACVGSQGEEMRPSRSRIARKALIWSLAIFALCQIALAAIIEIGLPQLRDPAYGNRVAELKWRLAKRHDRTRSPKIVVMLGSSRTANSLRGSDIEAQLEQEIGQPVLIQNLGVPGAGPMQELLYLGRLRQQGLCPDLLLIEVLPIFLGQSSTNRPWVDVAILGLNDLAMLAEFGLAETSLYGQWSCTYALPFRSYRGTIISETLYGIWPRYGQRHWSHRCDCTGWLPQPVADFSSADRLKAQEHARQEYEAKLRNFRLCSPSCRALDCLLQECRRARIPSALVLMPEATDFQYWYSPEARRQIDEYLIQLSAENDMPLIDARNWLADEDFCDFHHPLNRGALAFSERLGHEAIVPLLRKETGVDCQVGCRIVPLPSCAAHLRRYDPSP